jgi:putative colanic acid biosynthesis UDP-glucose lipid carrier transferase
LVDAGVIVVALLFAQSVAKPSDPDHLAAAAGAMVVAFYLVAEFTGLYRSWRGTSVESEILCGLWTWSGAVLSVMAFGFFISYTTSFTRSMLMTWIITAPIVMFMARVFVRLVQRTLRSHGLSTRNFAIVGVTDLGFQLAHNVEATPHLGLKLVGYFDDRPAARTPNMPEGMGNRVGNIDELIDECKAGRVSMVYITFPMRAEHRIRDVLSRLSDTTASVYVVPDFLVFELLHSRWTNIGGVPAVSVFENPFYGVDGVIKRICDVVLASVFICVAALPMALIALLIKLTSKGPVIFRQKRYGLDGQSINVWKFRSMRTCDNGPVVAQATKDDPRVTPLGKFLRRTSLDELPQLFNVIEGSMSLVGPRPHANAHNEAFRKMIQGYMLRHKVKPGITGLAQVSGARGETDTLEKMKLRIEYDHRYIREWSLWLDIKILFRTIFTVLRHQNAY